MLCISRPIFKVYPVVADTTTRGLINMGKRIMYNTTLNCDLLKKLKILAVQLELRQNDLIEEAIRDLLKKYKQKKALKDVSKD